MKNEMRFCFPEQLQKRTLGVQERYLEASGKTVDEEMMDL